MHGLNRPLARPLAPPLAKRRPKFSVHHGVELVDEYAWLRAENWQEVMRDPSVLEGDIREYLEAEFGDIERGDTSYQSPTGQWTLAPGLVVKREADASGAFTYRV